MGDLDRVILRSLHMFHEEIDLVVGIPRSGLLAANLVALHLGVPLADLDGFLEGRVLSTGARLHSKTGPEVIDTARRILVFDDSVFSGSALETTRRRIEASSIAGELLYGAAFVVPSATTMVDIACEVVSPPRVFSWNLMSHSVLERSCLDIDGVLCLDPTPEQNDDGPNYRTFLRSAVPHMLPGQPVQALVTSRLEKYRAETEEWLAHHGVVYDALHMLDLPDAAARRAANAHAAFKASVYRGCDAILFIESNPRQAREIARTANKAVLCTGDFSFHEGNTTMQPVRRQVRRVRGKVRRIRSLRRRP
ncbi:MAG: phosphoribosyltransferase family protein [Acidimicrobiales bacterium]